MTRRLLVTTTVVAVCITACGAFTSPEESSSGLEDTGPGEVALDGGGRREPGVALIDGAASDILFSDNFERAGDAGLIGEWSSIAGVDHLARESDGTTFVLVARGDDKTGPPTSEASLGKVFPGAHGLDVELWANVEKVSGGYGPNPASDYCEIAAIDLANTTIAMVYVGQNGLSVYLPPTASGPGADPDLNVKSEGLDLSRVKFSLTWTDDVVKLGATIRDVATAPLSEPLAPDLAKQTATLRVGIKCPGNVPTLKVRIDNVVVRTPQPQ